MYDIPETFHTHTIYVILLHGQTFLRHFIRPAGRMKKHNFGNFSKGTRYHCIQKNSTALARWKIMFVTLSFKTTHGLLKPCSRKRTRNVKQIIWGT